MKKYLFVSLKGFCFILAILALPAQAATSAMDKTFVMKAAQGGMTEVQLGQLAADKGSSPDVKSFGAQMVTDHGKANAELMTIASGKGIELSGKLDSKHQAMVDKMSAMEGTAFDKAYVEAMVAAHKKDDALFTKEASSSDDADLKAFAGKTDETIRMHLKMIQDIQAKK